MLKTSGMRRIRVRIIPTLKLEMWSFFTTIGFRLPMFPFFIIIIMLMIIILRRRVFRRIIRTVYMEECFYKHGN